MTHRTAPHPEPEQGRWRLWIDPMEFHRATLGWSAAEVGRWVLNLRPGESFDCGIVRWRWYPNRRRWSRMVQAREHGTHTEEEWLRIVEAAGGACLACGDTPVTKDHVVPVSRGGSDGADNLQPLCRACNSRKGSQVQDFREGRDA